jgi:protein O-GlcNAc transferase
MITHNRITIGVPVFNEERHLAKTLESLVCQTMTDFRVLIADNGSTDATRDISLACVAADSRFSYVRHKDNIGAIENARFLYLNTNSPFYMPLSGHDLIDQDYLRKQIGVLEANPDYSLAYSFTKWIDEHDNVVRITDGGDFLHDESSGVLRYAKIARGPWDECTAINGVLRRSALAGATFHHVCGPDHLMLAWLQFSGRFFRSAEPLYFRREFSSRSHGYVRRLEGEAWTGSEERGAAEYGQLCRAHVGDYLRLPARWDVKIAYLPLLLRNLDHAYNWKLGLLYRTAKRMRLISVVHTLRR